MKFRTAYGERDRQTIEFTEPSLTKQAFRDQCEIHNILKRYQRTGIIEHVTRHQASYGDVSGADFHEAQLTIAKAKTLFQELPAAAREHFGHDPAKFLEFTEDLDEPKLALLAELGLAKPREQKVILNDIPEVSEDTPADLEN